MPTPSRTPQPNSTNTEDTGTRNSAAAGVGRDAASDDDRPWNELGRIEDQFELLVQAVDEYALFVLSPDGYVETWNAGAAQIKGYTEEEILGEHFSLFYTDQDVAAGRPEAALKHAARDGQWTDEGWRVRNDGSRFWARVTIKALHDEDGNLRGFAKVTRDMTDRRRQEEKLRQQKKQAERENALLHLMQRVTAIANETTNLEAALQEATDEICKRTGWPVGHVYWLRPDDDHPLVPSNIWCIESDRDFEAFRRVSEEANFDLGESLPGLVASQGEPVWIPDVSRDRHFVRAQRADDIGVRGAFAVPVQVGGETVAVLEFFSAKPKEKDEKLMEAVQSVGVQLSRVAERERTHRELEESEQKFRALAEQSLVGIELIQEGVYRYVNPTFAGLFGYAPEELIGRSPEVIFHPEDWPRVNTEIRRRIEGNKEASYFIARGRTRNGETVYLQVYGRQISYRGRPAIVGASLDVTEQRRLQREMLQLQEEERCRIGKDLHDVISSQLTGATIKLSTLSGKTEERETKEALNDIQELIRESAAEVRKLSHGLSPGGLSDGDLFSALHGLARNTEGARFENALEGERRDAGRPEEEGRTDQFDFVPPDAEVATHLYRIVQEATTNARKYAEADEMVIRVGRQNGGLVVEVEDNGVGFDPSSIETEGLGLRSMQHRAELLGADLTVDSAPGDGTLVRCRLPAQAAPTPL